MSQILFRGAKLSRVELESFLKSFTLFFSSIGVLVATLFFFHYQKEVKKLDETILSEMRVCSFDLNCSKYVIDFAPIQNQELYTLQKDSGSLKSHFPISSANDYYLSFEFSAKKYNDEKDKIFQESVISLFVTLVVVFILSTLFSIYALSPLRSALLLTQEFIKDILHDFNTPLSALRLNSFMLKREVGENEKILRIEQAIENILSLEENLKAYLFEYEQKKELVDVKELIENKVSLIQKNYDDITFEVKIENAKIEVNKNAFGRVCENILTNAAKYNVKNGRISIIYDKKSDKLSFIDTGKGIKNPSKMFDRFYKEQERGVGIGLHIVKKLCDELKIGVEVHSEVGKGTNFSLLLTQS
jgi:two-component system OmpR family sensor kinase